MNVSFLNNFLDGISVVLPNYNGMGLLKANLPALFHALNKSGLPYEVIIADDCSNDDSLAFLAKEYPQIRVYSNSINSGFSVTCNLGIRHARFRLVCIVNTDVRFTEDYFVKAVPYFEDNKIFAVCGIISNYKDKIDKPMTEDGTKFMYFRRGLFRFSNEPYSKQKMQYDHEFPFLGCCFVARNDLLQRLSGFDEIYAPYYWEDSDLPLRAIKHGFKVKFAPECVIHHKVSSTIGRTQKRSRQKIIANRNKLIFCWNHLCGTKRWLIHISYMCASIALRWIILDWKFYLALFLALYREARYCNRFSRNDKFAEKACRKAC